jgi:hypothetical protein
MNVVRFVVSIVSEPRQWWIIAAPLVHLATSILVYLREIVAELIVKI